MAPATGTAGDDELVGAVAAGDRRALELLYRRHAPWLAGRLASRTSSDAAGERVDPAAGPEDAALGRDASARIRLQIRKELQP